MPFIATGATTVGEVIDTSIDFLLNGMFHERQPGRNTPQKDIRANKAQRRALEIVREHLNEIYCGDANTLFKDIPVPANAKPWVKAT